ncbi:hypothetical protein [Sulfitobacter mediterraneus]|nr:hypothetical protein [Sulfitobacter mediterraneus]
MADFKPEKDKEKLKEDLWRVGTALHKGIKGEVDKETSKNAMGNIALYLGLFAVFMLVIFIS